MPTLTVTGITVGQTVDQTSIKISFSAAIDQGTTDTGAANPENFTFYDPAVPGFAVPTNPDSTWNPVFSDNDNAGNATAVTWNLPKSGVQFNPGDFVLVTVTNIAIFGDEGNPSLDPDPTSLSRLVPGTDSDNTARTARNVEDAVSYPVLTEEIGYRPSPVGIQTGGGGGGMPGGGGSSNIGQMALKAVTDVLGWKANAADPKGFVGALTQSFTLSDVEGHVQSTWTPRTYAVQTDLGGGITGAQASLYMRAKDALDQSLSLLDGLYPLDPEADPEYVKALREMARSQMSEIVREFGAVGLPSILRINTYFDILVGQHDPTVQFDPDKIEGTLGELRDTYGIYFAANPFNNSVEDEQDITNFRVISDYMTSLLQSWIANRDFFRLGTTSPAFFGTQLVLISRQFNVITETVNEVRFTLDSVFIGPNERQTLLLEFFDAVNFPPMFLEDVLDEVEKFASEEGPRLLRDAGKISVTNNLLPVVDTLAGLINQAHNPANGAVVPDGYRTARVQKSLDDLQDQLNQLITLIVQVEQQLPPTEGKLAIDGVLITYAGGSASIFGDGFTFTTGVTINSSTPQILPPGSITFFSAQRLDVTFVPQDGPHDITVTNPNGESATLVNAFTVTNGQVTALKRTAPAAKGAMKGIRYPTVKRGSVGTGAVRPPAAAGKPAPPPTPPGAKPGAPGLPLTDDEKAQLAKHLENHPLWAKIKHLF